VYWNCTIVPSQSTKIKAKHQGVREWETTKVS
jgi:hypothetical protein